MKKQAEDFKINQVRHLRASALRLLELAQHVPKSVFHYLKTKFAAKILNLASIETEKFMRRKAEDAQTKEEHLRLFKPNLANPANKLMT
jgi:hypothetical protein